MAKKFLQSLALLAALIWTRTYINKWIRSIRKKWAGAK